MSASPTGGFKPPILLLGPSKPAVAAALEEGAAGVFGRVQEVHCVFLSTLRHVFAAAHDHEDGASDVI